MRLSYLLRGLPGHPNHPPLTDATIGTYTVATVLAIGSVLGIAEHATAQAWWLCLLVGLASTVLTAFTGFLDWLQIEWGSELWKTATFHMTVMLTATVAFLIAALLGHDGYKDQAVDTLPFVLTLIGFGLLTLGGWLGGSIVYVHGMRVLQLVEEPTDRAVAPAAYPEKEEAEGG